MSGARLGKQARKTIKRTRRTVQTYRKVVRVRNESLVVRKT